MLCTCVPFWQPHLLFCWLNIVSIKFRPFLWDESRFDFIGSSSWVHAVRWFSVCSVLALPPCGICFYVPSPLLYFVQLRRLTDSYVRATGIWYMQKYEYCHLKSMPRMLNMPVYCAMWWVVGGCAARRKRDHHQTTWRPEYACYRREGMCMLLLLAV